MYVKTRLPVYEGDGLIHGAPAPGRVAAAWSDVEGIRDIRGLETRARQLRGETLARLLRQFVAWARRRLSDSRSAALDEYLSRATSLADVERRLREVERNGSFLPG